MPAGGCIGAIQMAGYSATGAPACSACKDNQVDLSGKCTMMIDCLGTNSCTSSSCSAFLNCQNMVGGSSILANCVSQLVVAACGS
jgi:hypothetical protein